MGVKRKLMKGAAAVALPRIAARLSRRRSRVERARHWATNLVPNAPGGSAGSVAKGLGAAAVAIPVGLWAGRRLFGGGEAHPS